MAENFVAAFVENMAEKTKAANPQKEGDYIGEDGLLRCGVCGEKKETYVHLPARNGKPAEERKVSCVCDCYRKQKEAEEKEREREEQMRRIERLKRENLMDENFATATFQNFNNNGSNETNYKLCRRYCEAFDKMLEKPQGLLFWGEVGTGKSFAAACIAHELLDKGIPTIMTSFVKILEMIQGDKEKEAEIMYHIGHVKLLIIDDLGTERNTSYAIEKVYNIIDGRYRAKLPMILTTNLRLNDMMDETDISYRRIYDRILEVCYPMQFTGGSWRRKMAKNRFDQMSKLLEG